ncbi:MAG: hypothetical protein AAFY36_18340 [Bacteroidota bacterium]
MGLIDFDPVPGDPLLVGYSHGSIDCSTTFQIKSDNRFIEGSVCFGIREFYGTYDIQNDTIFFRDVQTCSGENYFEFATVQQELNTGKEVLVRYRNLQDTVGSALEIVEGTWYGE